MMELLRGIRQVIGFRFSAGAADCFSRAGRAGRGQTQPYHKQSSMLSAGQVLRLGGGVCPARRAGAGAGAGCAGS